MSRTIHRSKGPGYDYWGRRPYSGNYGYGPAIKRLTHRKERRDAKRAIYNEGNASCTK